MKQSKKKTINKPKFDLKGRTNKLASTTEQIEHNLNEMGAFAEFIRKETGTTDNELANRLSIDVNQLCDFEWGYMEYKHGETEDFIEKYFIALDDIVKRKNIQLKDILDRYCDKESYKQFDRLF